MGCEFEFFSKRKKKIINIEFHSLPTFSPFPKFYLLHLLTHRTSPSFIAALLQLRFCRFFFLYWHQGEPFTPFYSFNARPTPTAGSKNKSPK